MNKSYMITLAICSLFIFSIAFLSGCTTTAPVNCVNVTCNGITACRAPNDIPPCAPPHQPNTTNTGNQSVSPIQNSSVPVTPQSANASLSASHNAFGFVLFNIVLSNQGQADSNVLISPTSISLALSMAYAGSAGTTQEAMGNSLQFGNASPDAINQESQSLMQALSNRGDINLTVANSLWLNSADGFQFMPNYQSSMGAYYDATAQTLNFNDEPASADAINGWVGNKTNGKITSIVQSSVLPDYQAALVNAVYFKGRWMTPFDPNLTQNETFTGNDGTRLQVPMMSQSGAYSYFEEKDGSGNVGLQAIQLPYGNLTDHDISMYVFLPSNISNFTQGLNENRWDGMNAEFGSHEGSILLPKFKYGFDDELIPALSQMGMGVAFSSAANFSKMSDTPLVIGTVEHKAYIETDEQGSEAAAATFIGMAGAVYNPTPPFSMDVDHPFFYAIVDGTNGEILFMGVVNDPLAQ